MKRDIQALSAREFDVVIVGCGIYGAAAAREAAMRGLSVAVFDRRDIGGATSANSLKIIHGGLRYLQQMDVIRTRESCRERRATMRIAPHLVNPMPCTMPTSGHLMKGPEAMFAGMLLNEVISFDRNRGQDPQKHIPPGRVVSASACRKLVPGLPEQSINGGALWHDALAHNTERLVFEMVQDAVRAGAVAANYVRCTGFVMKGSRVTGVRAQDALNGDALTISGRVVLNSAGPWADALLAQLDRPPKPVGSGLAMGMNLVLNRRILPSHAAGLRCPAAHGYGSRLFFFVPWRDRTMVGTFYRTQDGSPEVPEVRDSDIDTFIADINATYPPGRVTRDDVGLVLAGLLPGMPGNTADREPKLRRHYRLVDHATVDGVDGLFTALGVKYTTARDVAQRTVDALARKLDRPVTPSRSARDPLPGGGIRDVSAFLKEARKYAATANVTEGAITRLARTYGTAYRDVLSIADDRPELLASVGGGAELTAAEVLYAVRDEMALTLGDVVFRRTELGTAGLPTTEALGCVARLMAAELDWDDDRTRLEVQAVSAARFPGDEKMSAAC